ncbi:MAG: hypothetical protein JO279_12310, partial [Verrucomicrobia bacterium]|nr:hypothetical protein [Verrucomicrobiota bacterium]
MNENHLTNYMKDHFAGSVAAIELLDHLISSHRGKTGEQDFKELRREVGEDQEVLRGLLHDLNSRSGPVRDSAAFLGEKLTRIKLLLEDPSGSQLARLEKLEALALGIDGKGALWRSLQAVAEEIPALREVDLSSLNRRAEEQRQRVEKLRIEAAREAFV